MSRVLYFPVCGPTENHLKSAITPYLAGDIKLDKAHYVTTPVSREDLRRPLRNVFAAVDGQICSVADPYGDPSEITVEAGLLWHRVTRRFPSAGLSVKVTNFCPVTDDTVELMRVDITNDGDGARQVVPTIVVPLFARALENKHDHEHVTSLLHRITQLPEGVLVSPTMKFDEEGHLVNERVYYVYGVNGNGTGIEGSFPTIPAFCGEQGDLHRPQAVYDAREPQLLSADDLQGQEAVGALRFGSVDLQPGQTESYLITVGTAGSEEEARDAFGRYKTVRPFEQALADSKEFWGGEDRVYHRGKR